MPPLGQQSPASSSSGYSSSPGKEPGVASLPAAGHSSYSPRSWQEQAAPAVPSAQAVSVSFNIAQSAEAVEEVGLWMGCTRRLVACMILNDGGMEDTLTDGGMEDTSSDGVMDGGHTIHVKGC